MSQAYMETLCNGQPLTEHLEFYRSRQFDLLEHSKWREFLRLIIGFFRYLSQSKLSNYVGEDLGHIVKAVL